MLTGGPGIVARVQIQVIYSTAKLHVNDYSNAMKGPMHKVLNFKHFIYRKYVLGIY
jgi:hypothetical protein